VIVLIAVLASGVAAVDGLASPAAEGGTWVVASSRGGAVRGGAEAGPPLLHPAAMAAVIASPAAVRITRIIS
jgi:hypothetical protein